MIKSVISAILYLLEKIFPEKHELCCCGGLPAPRWDGTCGKCQRLIIADGMSEAEPENRKLKEAQEAYNESVRMFRVQVESLQSQLGEARDGLKAIERNDKTVYGYRGQDKEDDVRHGLTQEWPPAGDRWLTPREIARQTLRLLEPPAEGK